LSIERRASRQLGGVKLKQRSNRLQPRLKYSSGISCHLAVVTCGRLFVHFTWGHISVRRGASCNQGTSGVNHDRKIKCNQFIRPGSKSLATFRRACTGARSNTVAERKLEKRDLCTAHQHLRRQLAIGTSQIPSLGYWNTKKNKAKAT
jgi:hypothetical protein